MEQVFFESENPIPNSRIKIGYLFQSGTLFKVDYSKICRIFKMRYQPF